MADNSRAINRVFTKKVLCELLQNGKCDVFDYVVRRYVDDPESKNHGQLINEIYTHLSKQQRNEYYYMNTLLNKLLCGIHNVNTTSALSQVRIGRSIADFVMINGEGIVYEIKSDLDNFDRLYDQLKDYYCAFSKVSVLASIYDYSKLIDILSSFGEMGEAVGVYVLSKQNSIFNRERSRTPLPFNGFLNHTSLFKLLRKTEYTNIVRQYFGYIPIVEPVFHFTAFLEEFKKIPIYEAQSLAFQELKKRNTISLQDFESIQLELKSVVYFSGLSKRMPEIQQLMESKYGR